MPLQDGLSSFAKDDFEAALRLVCDPLIPLSEKTDSIQFLRVQLNPEVNGLIVSLTSLTSKRELDIELTASETQGAFIKYLLNSEHRLPQNRSDANRLLRKLALSRIRNGKRDFHRQKRTPVQANGQEQSVVTSENIEFAVDYRSGSDPTRNIEEQERYSEWEAKLKKDALKQVFPLLLGGLTLAQMADELSVTVRTISRRIAEIKKLMQDCMPAECRRAPQTTDHRPQTTDHRPQTKPKDLTSVSNNFRISRINLSRFLPKPVLSR